MASLPDHVIVEYQDMRTGEIEAVVVAHHSVAAYDWPGEAPWVVVLPFLACKPVAEREARYLIERVHEVANEGV